MCYQRAYLGHNISVAVNKAVAEIIGLYNKQQIKSVRLKVDTQTH